MTLAELTQILAACFGVIGSIFFAIGVMRQSVDAMADLAGSYFDWNKHMVVALAHQKADYLFGGCLIMASFNLQLLSFLGTSIHVESLSDARDMVAMLAVTFTMVGFLVLRRTAARVARKFEVQIEARLREKQEEHRGPKKR
jgi:hypothetical protein